MPEHRSRLPGRPSLEQLRKQAKDLLKAVGQGDPEATARVDTRLHSRPAGEPPTLGDVQFALAREYGFESWTALARHVDAINPPGLSRFESMAAAVADAYMAGDVDAIREINWVYGTSFAWERDLSRMRRRLRAWFDSDSRDHDLARADARDLVARQSGFGRWADLIRSLASHARASRGPSGPATFYRVDREAHIIEVGGPLADRQWEMVASALQDEGITGLRAGGMTDTGLDRVSRVEHLTHLFIGGSGHLTDEGLRSLARLPRLEELDLGGPRSVFTDRGLDVLRHLPALRRFEVAWAPRISDAGIAHLRDSAHLQVVNLMGTPTGNEAIAALTDKPRLGRLSTGRLVTDAGIPLLHRFASFNVWQGGEPHYDLMSFDAGPTNLLLDGPFTDAGLRALAGLDGLFGLNLFWHTPGFTPAGLGVLAALPTLGFLGCDGRRCDDVAMRHIAAIPGLKMLMAQGTIATDAGFEALSHSATLEYLWGRECPNLTGVGFTALARMPALRGLAVSCTRVNDAALATLPHFPALLDLMPMDVCDEGFRYVGRCTQLEALWCMYCRDTTDTATGHIADLTRLRSYYAGMTRITDRSLEILGRMTSLERLEFWEIAGITDGGIAALTRLPQLRRLSIGGSPRVTRAALDGFPPGVRVSYSA